MLSQRNFKQPGPLNYVSDDEDPMYATENPNESSGRNGNNNKCIAKMCQGSLNMLTLKCIKECFLKYRSGVLERKLNHDVSALETRNKRIINDETSQCIQSYCGGKKNRERLRCIVLSCHRA